MATLPQENGASASGDGGSDANRPLRRARTSKPKVKTGCNNCKQRRIKCDETRPACLKCVKSKKTCTGYPPPPRRSGPYEEIKILPKPTETGPAIAPGPVPGSIQFPPRLEGPYTEVKVLPKLAHNGHILAPGSVAEPIQFPPRRFQKVQQRRLTPPQTPVSLYRPSINLPFQSEEGQYFQLFRSQTASELSGFFDNVFWTQTVLRECHTEKAIRHAVVALGALYKTLEKWSESPPASPEEGADPNNGAFSHWEVALKQYSEAINALTRGGDEQDPVSHRTRLMAIVLLSCFDSFIGDHKQTIRQIQTGLGLLEQLRAERRRAFVAKPEEPVEDELIQMFTRLAIQAKSYDMAFHFEQPYVIRLLPPSTDPASPPADPGSPVSTHQEPIPARFSTILEARIAWDTLCEKMFRFTEYMFQIANGPRMILPTSMVKYGMTFKQQIQDWSAAFEHLLASRTAPGVKSQEKAGIAVLKMSQINGQIIFLMTFSDNEGQFDSFTPQFKAIVDLALEVVGDEERRAAEKRCPDPRNCTHHKGFQPDIFGGYEYTAQHIKPSFSTDMGIVPPLYVTATKCRDPIIRRQAIQLLRSSARREGMWDSELMARISMWVTEVEEEEDEGEDVMDVTLPDSPAATVVSRSSNRDTRASSAAASFGDEVQLGPGGNARWDDRRASQVSAGLSQQPQYPVVPAEKRVLIRSCEFDLRGHTATLTCGSRNIKIGAPDPRARTRHIAW